MINCRHSSGQDQNTDKSSNLFDFAYFRTMPFFFQLGQIVLDTIVLICASLNYGFTLNGGGFVSFVAISSLLTVLTYTILCLTHFDEKIDSKRMPLFQFVWLTVFLVLYMVSFIIAASNSSLFFNGVRPSAIIATTVFCGAATILKGFLCFRAYSGYKNPSS